MQPHYRIHPSPSDPSRWLVVHPVADGQTLAVVDDCPTQAAAEKAAAWLEAERTQAAHWHRHEARPPSPGARSASTTHHANPR